MTRWNYENKLRITLVVSAAIHLSLLFAFKMHVPGNRLRPLQTTIELMDFSEDIPAPPKPREIVKKTDDAPAEEIVEQKASLPPAPKKQIFLPFYKVELLPVFKTRVIPVYPEKARKSGRTSRVILEAYIDAQGLVRQVRVLKSGGKHFDQAAMAALKKSSFKPARIMDQNAPVKIRIPYVFSLEN
ncbi:energy transducer TonB [bacterium]|nr:energy transducer TonB [bacterium]